MSKKRRGPQPPVAPSQNSSAFDQRYARTLAKKRMLFHNYGAGPQALTKAIKASANYRQQDLSAQAILRGFEATIMSYTESGEITTKAIDDFYKRYEDHMKQRWIIQDEWSEYHAMVAQQLGFSLVFNKGMWEIHSADLVKFPTNEDARNFVVEHEHDDTNMIYRFAIQAIIMGSMRGA